MRLTRIELYGFKSFAQRVVLEFPQDAASRGIAAIVGPNGSGKSNIADAVRWALGEQSLKLIRGKKSEDVIFAGSGKKSRLGMAEVTLTIDNSDHTFPVEFPEVTITRRVYRDGEGEYLLGGAKVRLLDVQLSLAKARLGVRTYSVIGQGMIEHFLTSSAVERKELFDDAAGIKEFELKRHATELKLEGTEQNLHEAEILLHELEPRYRSLSRAVKRMEEREGLEREYKDLACRYYGALWQEIVARLATTQGNVHALQAGRAAAEREHTEASQALGELKRATLQVDARAFQEEYERLRGERERVREEALRLKTALALAQARRAQPEKGVTISVAGVCALLESVHGALVRVRTHMGRSSRIEEIKKYIEELGALATTLEDKISEYRGDVAGSHRREDESEEARIRALGEREAALKREMDVCVQQIETVGARDAARNKEFFDVQQHLQRSLESLHEVEMRMGTVAVEVARLETRRDALLEEMRQEAHGLVDEIKSLPHEAARGVRPDELRPRLERVRHELAVIGGIDTEAVAEFGGVKERYESLKVQVEDLRKAGRDLRGAIEELTTHMTERRKSALHDINKEFEKFFRILFLGGSAHIVPIYGVVSADDLEEEEAERKGSVHRRGDKELVGIDIQATPPGKRVRDITMLSGGERALTAVALICAIISMNATPFVVLDEVDAALDEANAIRFAEIMRELSHQTQFIIITHNRATMEKGNILYGVTMGEEGVSKLLSVKLEEAEKIAK